MAVISYHDQKTLEGKTMQRAILGLDALESAPRFAATIRAAEIGDVSTDLPGGYDCKIIEFVLPRKFSPHRNCRSRMKNSPRCKNF